MSIAYYFTLKNMGAVEYTEGFQGVFAAVVISACFVAGAMLVVWMGNRINDKGIGNGISMILFAGIVARFPTDVGTSVSLTKETPSKYLFVSIAIAILVCSLMIGFVVFMNESERRIPIQYAKRVVGRKQYGGQSTHIPVKVCMSGVMPIIFAMAFMSLPSTIGMFKRRMQTKDSGKLLQWIPSIFLVRNHPFYAMSLFRVDNRRSTISMFQCSIILLRSLTTSDRTTAASLESDLAGQLPIIFREVLSKITLVGAVFLGIIAIFPIIFTRNGSQTDESCNGRYFDTYRCISCS